MSGSFSASGSSSDGRHFALSGQLHGNMPSSSSAFMSADQQHAYNMAQHQQRMQSHQGQMTAMHQQNQQLQQLQQQQQQMQQFAGGGAGHPIQASTHTSTNTQEACQASVNETNEKCTVTFRMQSVPKESLNLMVRGGRVSLTGTQQVVNMQVMYDANGAQRAASSSSSSSSFDRDVGVSGEAQVAANMKENVDLNYDDQGSGLSQLTLTINKRAQQQQLPSSSSDVVLPIP